MKKQIKIGVADAVNTAKDFIVLLMHGKMQKTGRKLSPSKG
jgi:hypothetical protein